MFVNPLFINKIRLSNTPLVVADLPIVQKLETIGILFAWIEAPSPYTRAFDGRFNRGIPKAH